MQKFWDLFSLVQTAVVLLLAVVVLSIVGTLLPQPMPSLYNSPYFIALQSLLGFSLFACSCNRLLTIFSGERNTYAWGSFFAHLSVLVIYLGAIYGSQTGFSTEVIIEKGSQSFVSPGNFQIKLNDFDASFDSQGRPLSYSSDLSILENGKETARQTIFVNGPLAHKGIKIYQSSYGLRAGLEVVGPSGKKEKLQLAKGGCAYYTATGLMFCLDEIHPDMGMLHGQPSKTYEPTKAVAYISVGGEEGGWLIQGKKIRWNGYTIKLAEVKEYTGLQVRKDPGVPLVYLGFCLLILGTGVMLYPPTKIIGKGE